MTIVTGRSERGEGMHRTAIAVNGTALSRIQFKDFRMSRPQRLLIGQGRFITLEPQDLTLNHLKPGRRTHPAG